MSDQTTAIVANPSNYFVRVISNDAAKKAAATALAGLVVAAVSEALWPSS